MCRTRRATTQGWQRAPTIDYSQVADDICDEQDRASPQPVITDLTLLSDSRLRNLLALGKGVRKQLLEGSVDERQQLYLFRKAEEIAHKFACKSRRLSIQRSKGNRRKTCRPGLGKSASRSCCFLGNADIEAATEQAYASVHESHKCEPIDTCAGVDLEVDLVVTSLAGEALFSGSLPHDTTVKFLRDAVQEAVAGAVIDGLLHGDQCLQLSETLGAAGIATGATLHAVFGSLRGDFVVEAKDEQRLRWHCDKSRTAVSVQPGDRQSFEESFSVKKSAADRFMEVLDFQEVIAIQNEEEHRSFMEDSRLDEWLCEWTVKGRNAIGEKLYPFHSMRTVNERMQQHGMHVYPILYKFVSHRGLQTSKVSEIVECTGPALLQLLCKSTNGLTYDMALTRLPNDTATGARLKSCVKSAHSAVYFTYTQELRGYLGHAYTKSRKGIEVFVGGHRLSMLQTRKEYFADP